MLRFDNLLVGQGRPELRGAWAITPIASGFIEVAKSIWENRALFELARYSYPVDQSQSMPDPGRFARL
ncbi:MAG: hypothetical protein PsegKO_23280 [Pseudohongiellaceae bacterium]